MPPSPPTPAPSKEKTLFVTGKRSDPPQMGVSSETVNVQFGVSSGGGMTITCANGATFKMAA